jgi:hypothetical protein
MKQGIKSCPVSFPQPPKQISFSIDCPVRSDISTEYCEENIELLISFGSCIHDCEHYDLLLDQNDLDTFLAHSGFFPELKRDHIIWHGIGLRFDYWDPEKTESPFLEYPKIYEYPG